MVTTRERPKVDGGKMRVALKLELIGGAYGGQQYMGRDTSRPWVARITGFDDEYGYKREFMRGRWDYTNASSTGRRGIFVYYALEPGLYQVHERISWKHSKRYFILVQNVELYDSEIQKITQEEADQWLKKNCSGSMYARLPLDE